MTIRLTEKDIGREVVTLNGDVGKITTFQHNTSTNCADFFTVVFKDGAWNYYVGGYFCGCEHEPEYYKHLSHFADNPPKTEPNKPEEAMRFDDNKLRFDLIPHEAMIELARAFTIGAIKYEDNNFRKGMKFSRCVGPLERHWNLWKCGQDTDPDTKCHHLASVLWNAAVLLTYQLREIGTDDRIKYPNVDALFNLIDNPMGLGMSPEEMKELREKYKQQREKNK